MPVPARSAATSFLCALLLAFLSSVVPLHAADNMTPVLLAVQDAPIPFQGSDGRTHLVYELWMTNASSADVTIEKLEVIGDGAVLKTLDAATIAGRLQPVGQRASVGTLAKSTQALLFVHVVLAQDAEIPQRLSHRVSLRAAAAPPGHQELTEEGGEIKVDMRPMILVGPPLRGAGYVSADSCCDATRHTRAALPVNGRVWISQRYAVDWEKVDDKGRIYSGPREKLASYAIFGQPVLAVAKARVVHVINNAPEQTPGQYPTNISPDQADGNSVILEFGNECFALYAHMQPGSVRVHVGDTVEPGQVIGLVGDSGNSVAPHLHFQVMQGPSSLAANGLPYAIRNFEVTGKTPGTAAFDDAEEKGTPLPITLVSPPQEVRNAMPLDQLIITFPQ